MRNVAFFDSLLDSSRLTKKKTHVRICYLLECATVDVDRTSKGENTSEQKNSSSSEEREQVKGIPRSESKRREGFQMARRIRKEGVHAITPGKEGIVEGIRVEAARL